MAIVTDVIVRVDLTHRGETLSYAEVIIPVTNDHPLKVSELVDACQRSVAHCIDELQKHLDSG